MDRWGPMPGYAHCALRGNGYHDALGGRGARALRFDSTLRRRAGDAAPAPTRATSEARAAGALGRCVMGTCCTAYGLSRGARARRRGAHVSYSGR